MSWNWASPQSKENYGFAFVIEYLTPAPACYALRLLHLKEATQKTRTVVSASCSWLCQVFAVVFCLQKNSFFKFFMHVKKEKPALSLVEHDCAFHVIIIIEIIWKPSNSSSFRSLSSFFSRAVCVYWVKASDSKSGAAETSWAKVTVKCKLLITSQFNELTVV